MTYKDQGTGGSAPRWLPVSRRGRQAGGIAIAVVGAGLMATLTGCGPLSVAATGQPHGGHSATTGGHKTTTSTSSSSGTSSSTTSSGSGAYSFTTLDNPADPTFNQLLGFNNGGIIAGYFGSGAAGHPNKGYVLVRTRAGFRIMNENFPGSTQTQVTGLNDRGVTVGFWSDMNASQNNDNFGFYWLNGRFHNVNFPTRNNAMPPVNQLLGVNNQNIAVGFYNDAKGNSHGYLYSIRGGWFHSLTINGAASVTAAAINNSDDVAGFFTNAAGTTTDGFLRTAEGRTYTLAYPGASMTQALGVNDFSEVVGVYTVGSGNSAVTHGFTWTPGRGFKSVDDPRGVGSTTINGVNDFGDLVGFYTDSAGNTDGFAAVPAGQRPLPGLIGATTTPTATPTTTMPSATPTSTMPTATPTTTMPSTSPTSTSSAPPQPSSGPPTFSGHNS
jgi:hypothetical protein